MRKLRFLPVGVMFFCAAVMLATAVIRSTAINAAADERSNITNGEKNKNWPVVRTRTPDIPDELYPEIVSRLRTLGANGSLEELRKEIDTVESNWGQLGGKNYGLIYREFLRILTCEEFLTKNPRALDVVDAYVARALKNADSFPLTSELSLLLFLRYPVAQQELSPERRKQRRENTGLWLHAIGRLNREKDPKFNAADAPVLNVALPEGVKGPPGMAPEHIADLQKRREYQRAIEENTRKIEYFSHQTQLRQDEEILVESAARYISHEYSQSRESLAELEQLFNTYHISDPLRVLLTKGEYK